MRIFNCLLFVLIFAVSTVALAQSQSYRSARIHIKNNTNMPIVIESASLDPSSSWLSGQVPKAGTRIGAPSSITFGANTQQVNGGIRATLSLSVKQSIFPISWGIYRNGQDYSNIGSINEANTGFALSHSAIESKPGHMEYMLTITHKPTIAPVRGISGFGSTIPKHGSTDALF